MLLIISNVMENVNLIVSLHSALCGSILAVIELTFCNIMIKAFVQLCCL